MGAAMERPEVVDVVVVGGSFAGLSAAIYLARGRRRVVVVDEGLTRNRFAPAGHSLFGFDGLPPAEIRAAGLRDLLAYPTASLVQGRVATITESEGLFDVRGPGVALRARRIILAHGMRDILPDLPGLDQVWGKQAFQCPYCHGYEAADRPTAIWMNAHMGLDHALFLRQWAGKELTLLTNGAAAPEGAERLAAAGIGVETGRLHGVSLRDGQMVGIVLDNCELPAEVLYMMPQMTPASDLATQLGLEMVEGPAGAYVKVDEMKQTSRKGVFAAGDLIRPMYGAAFAVADGAMAGPACHRSLVMEEMGRE
jgi:thioredoxin reductase